MRWNKTVMMTESRCAPGAPGRGLIPASAR